MDRIVYVSDDLIRYNNEWIVEVVYKNDNFGLIVNSYAFDNKEEAIEYKNKLTEMINKRKLNG